MLEFDLSQIADIAGGHRIDIESVSLVMHTATAAGTGSSVTIDLHEYGFDFDEMATTWNDPAGGSDPTAGGTLGTLLGNVTFAPNATDTDVIFADSAAFRTAVLDALAGADSSLRLLLKEANESGGQHFARFDGDEVGVLGNHPELLIAFSVVPEPSGWLLAMIGFAVLGLRQSRRRRRPA